ncbi:MAG: hypothetical protein KAX28_11530, partial [Candidatus Marinimicrobia bacterium]|nr:hypothetical protein [Candidatus Neomarinimicrobiota bacterium]
PFPAGISYILKEMERDRINKTKKSGMIKPPILYIDRREGRISGLRARLVVSSFSQVEVGE